MNEKPVYYAVIPAAVRYCKDLSPSQKLLYGEITALSNKTGQCFASNEYFANLYGVSKRTVTMWISALADLGFINRHIKYKEGTRRVKSRFLSILPYGKNLPHPYGKNPPYPHEEMCADNTTRVNNLSSDEEKLNSSRPDTGESGSAPIRKPEKPGRWVNRMVTIWKRYQGLISHGQMGKALKPAVKEYGEQVVAEALAKYAKNADPAFQPNPHKFARTINSYIPKQKPQDTSGGEYIAR